MSLCLATQPHITLRGSYFVHRTSSLPVV